MSQTWMTRKVLWTTDAGLWHVASRADVNGTAVISLLACGGYGVADVVTTTWRDLKATKGVRACRRCRAILEAAGISDPIPWPGPRNPAP
jgi:hypothetical protein